MDSISDELAPLLDAFNGLYILERARVGLAFLIAYDIAICFPTELNHIWKSRWSSGKWLYICSRYSTLLYLATFAIDYEFLDDCPLGLAKGFNNIAYWCSIAVNIPFQVLVGFRTYALFHGSQLIRRIIVFLFTVQTLVVISVGVLYSKESAYGTIPLREVPCSFEFLKTPQASVITVLAANAVYDLVLWIMLAYKVYRAFADGQTRLIGVIFRLGLLYFTLVTSLYIVCTVLYIVTPERSLAKPAVVTVLLQVMQSVLSARFILELRTFVEDLSIQSLSVTPERVLEVEDEMRFGSRITSGDEAFEDP